MIPDNTTRTGSSLGQPQPGPGHSFQTLFVCGHKGQRLGAQMRGKLPLRCPACVKARSAR